ncbi:hypothetical protein [Paenibacillus sp. NFR01]|uniref:hypothetical protein n=1 Tax=Paenibacillus sp. NFR01 TaxID=1566279 RepID=UPI0008B2162E|nr:hypothetical protein [Paenibacillus sp. NFR01]SEU27832.1 hypothetical protein SAMN03159358_4627 [Paenibacillus sp. NFR01]
METILIMELKGFERITTELAQRMDAVQMSVEQIRSTAIQRVNEVIAQVSEQLCFPQEQTLIGGDTWYFIFNDFPEGINFGCGLLYRMYNLIIDHSIFYIKPSLAINIGKAKFDGSKFLDNDSITAYRKADKGEPFTFYAIGAAINESRRLGNIVLEPIDEDSMSINWLQFGEILNRSGQFNFGSINIPHILLNNEVQYFRSTSESVRSFIQLQERSTTISAFGGAVPYDIDFYYEYLKSMKKLIESQKCKCSIITYINSGLNIKYSYFWLKWCLYFARRYPQFFTIAAYEISGISAKPISFHIYDKSLTHIGLREYSLHKNQSIMSASILLKNEKIADRFYSEFQENFRSISVNNCDDMLENLKKSITEKDLSEAEYAFDKLLNEKEF